MPKMILTDPITVNIAGYDDTEKSTSLLDDLRSLQPVAINSPKKDIEDISEPVILSDHKQTKPKKKKKKKRGSSLMSISDDSDLLISDDDIAGQEEINTLLDVESILIDREKADDESDEIVSKGKKGYKKLKNGENAYKKEFAEEITLLYSLLDETTQYGKDLEKDLKAMRSSKVRGVSKYSNDLASLVLTAKQTKLNILKEISSVKKNIADLGIKESKGNEKNTSNNTSEALASQYFKNILSHGRTDFINRFTDDDTHDAAIAEIENSRQFSDREEYEYNKLMEERLTNTVNPFRSDAGNKYIEYEQRGVEIRVSKCIDTGEWDFIAVDKLGTRIDDYPLPDRRTVGRMKFTADGTYATDQMGRMYKVVEYYLPSTDEYDDDDYDD